MNQSDLNLDQETLKRIEERVLQEEDAQLHYKRPPSIIQDIKTIIEEEVPASSMDDTEV